MALIIAGVVLAYAGLAAALLRLGRAWVNPVFLILVYYLLNYPVRGFLLLEFPDRFNVHQFTEAEILGGLWYSSCYVLLFVGAYLLLLRVFSIQFYTPELRPRPMDQRLFLLTAAAVGVSGLIVMGYEISVGGSFSLGTEIEQLRRPFWVNVAGLPYSLRWFAICMGVLLWIRDRTGLIACATLLLIALSLGEALVTTAKGIVIAFLLLFLFVDNLLTGRVVRLSVLFVGILLSVLFSTYSYYARYSGGIGLESLEDYTNALVAFLEDDVLQIVDEGVISIVERATYYLDALLLMARTDASMEAGPYALGSLVELANLLPRGLEFFPEQYSFDRYVTHAVWGEYDFSQIFIGRIGESYFVLGHAGLLYALVHASIFAYVASRWRPLSRNVAGVALYFAILQGWLYQDASLTYQVKNLITIVLCYLLASAAVRLVSLKRGAVALEQT